MRKQFDFHALLVLVFLIALLGGALISCSNEEPRSAPSAAVSSGGIPDVPVKGMVTMLDIGATECIPCKMMAPIMEELEKEYHGKAAIVFIDVWKHREQGPKYGIRAIPTQIFYDKEGKEVYRHEGFMDKESIVAELRKLGVE
ncbi:thioredoxin family protein [Syntrophobacteraceae bacterium DRH4]|nr:thioredoxin family protein [Desulfoferrobacter suflitae]MCK8603666.1 thioredoxin family protein [Desulfoferrobacter suflitae]